MYCYRIVYGGQTTVKADSSEEAYEKFWDIIEALIEEGRFGLIVETTDPDVQGDSLERW